MLANPGEDSLDKRLSFAHKKRFKFARNCSKFGRVGLVLCALRHRVCKLEPDFGNFTHIIQKANLHIKYIGVLILNLMAKEKDSKNNKDKTTSFSWSRFDLEKFFRETDRVGKILIERDKREIEAERSRDNELRFS